VLSELIGPDHPVGCAGPSDPLLYRIHCRHCPDYVPEYVVDEDGEEDIAEVEKRDALIRKRFDRYFYEHPGLSKVLIARNPDCYEGYTVLDMESATGWFNEKRSALESYQRTLINMKQHTKSFGQVFNSINDRWLIPTMNDDEADAILHSLFDDGYVTGSRAFDGDEFSLTMGGLRYAQQVEAQGQVSQALQRGSADETPILFLSHSHIDDEFAERLATDLERNGIRVWYDGWDLDIGHDLTVKIQEGIASSQFLAVILSRAAVQSAWVEKEWTTGFRRELEQRRIVVLPILYQDCELPEFLKGKKYADFRRPEDYEAALKELARCLRGESKRPQR